MGEADLTGQYAPNRRFKTVRAETETTKAGAFFNAPYQVKTWALSANPCFIALCLRRESIVCAPLFCPEFSCLNFGFVEFKSQNNFHRFLPEK